MHLDRCSPLFSLAFIDVCVDYIMHAKVSCELGLENIVTK